jgi:small subunit ribosomal protein S20
MKAIESGNKEVAKAEFAAVVPEIDRMATKGILQKNRAAHYKSQLNARLRAMA